MSCTLESVDKDISYMCELRFGMFDVGCLAEATRKGELVASLDRSSGHGQLEKGVSGLSRMVRISQY